MVLAEPVIPRNADDVVHNVIVRQLLDDQNAANPGATLVRSPVLETMRRVTDAVRDGTSLVPLKPLIERFTLANTELAQVVGTMFVRYQTERLVSWLEDQDQLERFLRRCMQRGDLTPAEALVFLNMTKNEIKAIAEVLSEALKHGIPEPDAGVVSSKMDYTLQVTERQAMKDFNKTTPQGREIVRKLVFRARKKLNGTKRTANA